MLDFFKLNFNAYGKRVDTMLREARFAQLEHEAAAEHHGALARMYAERVARLDGVLSRSAATGTALDVTMAAAIEAQQPNDRPPFRVLRQNSPQVAGY
jgi:hypothetical protein